MNLHGLRLFHEIARWGSVTRAAQELKISQPAVTAQVKKFEQDNKLHLLEAAGRGVQLTALGLSVYEKSQQLFTIETEIEQLIENHHAEEAGVLRIAGNDLTVGFVLPKRLERFKNDKPDTQLQLATMNTAEALVELQTGTVELAFLGGGAEGVAEIIRQQICTDRLCLVAAPQHSSAGQTCQLAELLRQEFVGRETTSYTQQTLLKRVAAQGLKAPDFSLVYTNSRDALRAVIAGQGLHYCSYLMVAELISQGQLVEISAPELTSPHPIYLCWSKKRSLTRAARQFKESVMAN